MGDDLAPAGGPRWVTLEGGSFIAGSDDFYPDEAPARWLPSSWPPHLSRIDSSPRLSRPPGI